MMTEIQEALTRGALLAGASVELTFLIKSTMLFGAGLLAARAMRTARASVRHLVLACTFAAVAALPAAAALLPELTVIVPSEERRAVPAQSAQPDATAAAAREAIAVTSPDAPAIAMAMTATTAARVVWGAGALAGFAWLEIGRAHV